MNNDESMQSVLKKTGSLFLRAAAKGLSKLALLLFANLVPVLLPLFLVFMLFTGVYSVYFVLPRDMQAEGYMPVFSSGANDDEWTLAQDAELVERYKQLSERWRDGLETRDELSRRLTGFQDEIRSGEIVPQVEQAEPHRLPWSVLAAVDRVLGDPAVRGGNLREPEPEKHYEELKPVFTWKDFQVRKEISEWDEVNEHWDTREYAGRVKLLVAAETFEGSFIYHWKSKTDVLDGGSKKVTVTTPELVSLQKTPPYFSRLLDLLSEEGLSDPFEAELVLELAMMYDETYYIDCYEIGNGGALYLDLTKVSFSGEIGKPVWPLPGEYNRITSPYGMRIHPVLGVRRMHTGIDIAAPSGTEVFAALNGKVIFAGKRGGYGNTVIIDHGKYKTLYAHLLRVACGRDDVVEAGDVIGRVGSTGISTGPHLHFELRRGDSCVNPVSLLGGI